MLYLHLQYFEKKQNNNLNSQNLLLQKYLTQLTKEKMGLLVQINLCMNRLDNIEKYLGINIAAKRMKKNLLSHIIYKVIFFTKMLIIPNI